MAKNRKWIYALLFILPLVFVAGCQEYGKVDQGRVIKFEKDSRSVTFIRDGNSDPQNPDYNHLPPLTYTLPTNPEDTGPEPKAGLRMKLDTKNRQIVIFDPASQGFKTLTYTLIDQKEDVGKDDPLVFNKAEGKAKKFPAVDREKKTITIYSARQKIVTTFSLPDEYFSMPDATWDAGDEVRVYYKEAGKSLRFMNITRTDIFKK